MQTGQHRPMSKLDHKQRAEEVVISVTCINWPVPFLSHSCEAEGSASFPTSSTCFPSPCQKERDSLWSAIQHLAQKCFCCRHLAWGFPPTCPTHPKTLQKFLATGHKEGLGLKPGCLSQLLSLWYLNAASASLCVYLSTKNSLACIPFKLHILSLANCLVLEKMILFSSLSTLYIHKPQKRGRTLH